MPPNPPPSSLGRATLLRRKFREILGRKTLTVMTGSYSPVYARMAQEIGFELFFVSGSHVSAYLYGVPDNGIIGLREMVQHAGQVAAHADIPVLADGDTGYGNAVNVFYAVQEFVRSGVAGVTIEDQEAPKKSSTGAGRRCIPVQEAVRKIRAAVAARDELDPAFVVCARCDVMGAEGGTFEDALRRSIAYVQEGGADLVWLNSVETREQIRYACAAIPAPVMELWGGRDQRPGLPEMEGLGARISIFPNLIATFAMNAAWKHLQRFKAGGVEYLEDWRAAERTDVNLNALVRFRRVAELERAFLPDGAQRDYDTTWGHSSLGVGERR